MSESVIHDIGYQRYEGPRLGRGYAARSLYGLGVRTAFGIGRGAKAKIFPWIAIGIVLGVAVVVTAIRTQVGRPVMGYLEFPGAMSFLVLLFCAVVAPELVSRDLRSGVLPLYFSRPLTRSDYALAKLGAMFTAVWLLLAGPMLLMFVGGAFSMKRIGQVWDEFLDFLPGLGHATIFAMIFASLSLLVASLAGRRAVAAAIIVAVFLVTSPLVGVLNVVGGDVGRQVSLMFSPMSIADGLATWLFDIPGRDIGAFGPVYAAVVVMLIVGCVLLLLERYRKAAR